MPFRPALPPLSLALLLMPCLLPAQAAGPAPPAALPPPIVDPAARRLFTQMVAAQQALSSFTVTIDAQDQSKGHVLPHSQTRTLVAFAVPARAAATQTLDGKTLGELFSDGAVFTRVDTRHKEYRRDALPAAQAARLVETQIGNLGLLPRSFADPGGLLSLLNAPGLIAVARGALADPVNGVPVDSVVVRLVGSDAGQGTFTFVMGQSDHLLRRVSVDEASPARKSGTPPAVTHTETVTALQVNPPLPAAAFAYKPQAGFKKVPSAP